MIKYHNYVIIVIAIGAFLIVGFTTPQFLTFDNIITVSRQSATIALCAMGMALALIAKEIDLSTGGIMAFCAMVSGTLMLRGTNWILAMMVGLLLGIVIGMLSGWLISKLEIPSFIATFVMGQIGFGFALVMGQGRSIGSMSSAYERLGNDSFLGIHYVTWIMLIFLVGITFLLKSTRMGKHIYALGGNEATVKLEGISTSKVKIFVFATSGFCAASAGILLSAQMNAVHPTQGSNYQLDAVAAAVIGGVSMLGGSGKAWMPVVGAFVIGFLRNALALRGMHPHFQNLVIGAAIIVVVGLSVYSRNKALAATKVF